MYPRRQTEDESSESKRDEKELVCVYKVVQHLDVPGYEFDAAKEVMVLGTFDDEDKANHAVFEQHEVIAAFCDPTASLMSKSDGMLHLKMHHSRRGVSKEVKLEVQREVRKPQAPSSILSSQADGEDESPESERDKKEPVCVYKVIQHCDIPGFKFHAADKTMVLDTFDEKEKAIHAVFEQHQTLAAFGDPTSSTMSKAGGLLNLTMRNSRRGKSKQVKFEVQREERKPQGPREVFEALQEVRKIDSGSMAEDDL